MRDVIIVGGGPAGSTAGKIIADVGKDVVILERTQSSQGACGGTIGGSGWRKQDSTCPKA